MRASEVRACLAFGELSVTVRFEMTDLCTVVLCRRRIFHKVLECPVSVSAQRFRKNDPSLCLGEDAAVFLDTLVIDDRKRAVEGMVLIRRIHQENAVIGIQDPVDGIQGSVCLFRGRKAADDSPALRIEPHAGFGVVAFSDDIAVFGIAADEAVFIPAQLLKQLAEVLLGFLQEGNSFRILFVCGEFLLNRKGIVELHCDKGGFSVFAKPQAVIPVGVKTCRHAMGTQTVKRELNRPVEVFIDGGFLFVRKRNHFIQEGEVAGFTDVFVYGREEPERIIRTIGGVAGLLYIAFILRRIFMSGVMREFDKRESAAVMNLRG